MRRPLACFMSIRPGVTMAPRRSRRSRCGCAVRSGPTAAIRGRAAPRLRLSAFDIESPRGRHFLSGPARRCREGARFLPDIGSGQGQLLRHSAGLGRDRIVHQIRAPVVRESGCVTGLTRWPPPRRPKHSRRSAPRLQVPERGSVAGAGRQPWHRRRRPAVPRFSVPAMAAPR
jgi:hypothetical protein